MLSNKLEAWGLNPARREGSANARAAAGLMVWDAGAAGAEMLDVRMQSHQFQEEKSKERANPAYNVLRCQLGINAIFLNDHSFERDGLSLNLYATLIK
ncbi:hypothetical protein [Pseudorhodoplanes sinuspersici]|uniref:hypothetical protein n=1 Tax=Pseudorhodoplanes sinuspersici TaxID=1235591 RepID=UPI0012FD9B44|nr:hypothetical protein [Pseudorhodoplanes sinuspersici]